MSLDKYKQKRDFSKTSEPAGKASSGSNQKLRFVVHKHAARNIHYDLRLELSGVLKSWAVPKGVSLNPHDRHLAIQTEDHPIEYLKFHGTIPKGNYGAGKIEIFDSGTYEPRAESTKPEQKIKAELKSGHITFVLHGKKLKGEFALIKNEHISKDAWLIVKKTDKFAKTSKTGGVLSKLQTAPASKMPKIVKPMLASLIDAPFNNKGWLYEVKWDGYRAVMFWDQSKLCIKTRNSKDYTERFSTIAKAGRSLRHSLVLDGEVVSVDSDGKPHFEWLQTNSTQKNGKIVYYVFDILWCDGHDVTSWSLLERRRLLKKVLNKNNHIRLSEGVITKGHELYRQVVKSNLEGIVAKSLDSTYKQAVRGNDWLKLKSRQRQEFVIAGFTEPKGSRDKFGAILVGTYDAGKLVYRGHVGSGFNQTTLESLYKLLTKLARKTSPFGIKPKANGEVHWVKPELVCEVEFQELTKGGQLRQPSYVGLRSDKPAKEVVLEQAKHIGPAPAKLNGELQLTHLDKIFWPKLGITKGDILKYYQAVSSILLPYLKDRPESLLRHPDGISQPGFFQKDLSVIAPKWAKTFKDHSGSADRDITYLVANNLKSLEYMVQLGVIEINPWSSRIQKPNLPDWIVIDLDPEGVHFSAVIESAQAVRATCDELGIKSYPKTSGKTGIHIYIPMDGKYSYTQARQFAEILANLIHQKVPKLTSLERNPKKRQHRVYLDYLQNNKGQTLAAPYCVRPSEFAGVSMPLEWKEVKPGLKPQDFTILNALSRIKDRGDIFKPVLGRGINLDRVLSRVKLDEPQS